MHLRGPLNVSQLAVYQLPGDMHTLQKRSTVPFYNRRRAPKKRETGTTNHFQNITVDALHQHVPTNTTARTKHDLKGENRWYGHPLALATANERASSHGAPSTKQADAARQDFVRRAAGDWNRVAYYTSASPAQATGFSFLANLGDPQKSGTFD
jgi:hypothetical protein